MLGRLEVSVRQTLLTMGLGLFAVVVGSVFAGAVLASVAPRGDGAPTVATMVFAFVVVEAWAWAVLPLLFLGVARVLTVSPVASPLVAMGSGQIFRAAILYASLGEEGLHRDLGETAARVIALVTGIALSTWGIRVAQRAAARKQHAAQAAAATRAAEYEAFRHEAARIADKHDTKPT